MTDTHNASTFTLGTGRATKRAIFSRASREDMYLRADIIENVVLIQLLERVLALRRPGCSPSSTLWHPGQGRGNWLSWKVTLFSRLESRLAFTLSVCVSRKSDLNMLRPLWRTLFFLWLTSVLLVISFPWSKFDGTPHWDNIQWIPFARMSFHPTVLVETGANFLAFIPIGYLMVRSLSPGTRHPLLLASLLGLCSSASVEFYQLLCHDRVPATTDLLINMAGTVLGARMARGVDQLLNLCTVGLRRLYPQPTDRR